MNKERGGQITIIDCFTTQTTACLKFDFRLHRIKQQRNFLLAYFLFDVRHNILLCWITTNHHFETQSFVLIIGLIFLKIKVRLHALKSMIKNSTIHKNLQEITCSNLFFDDSSLCLKE